MCKVALINLWSLRTWDWEHVTITPQTLSLVKKVEPVQVRFTLRLRDQRSMWMQDGCKVYMDSYMASNGPCFMVTLLFSKTPFGGRPNAKPGDQGPPNAHNRWSVLFYHVWGPAWIKIHWNSIWLRAQSHIASHCTWRSVTTLHDIGGVLGRPLDTFLWALTIHGHGSWLVCEVALTYKITCWAPHT